MLFFKFKSLVLKVRDKHGGGYYYNLNLSIFTYCIHVYFKWIINVFSQGLYDSTVILYCLCCFLTFIVLTNFLQIVCSGENSFHNCRTWWKWIRHVLSWPKQKRLSASCLIWSRLLLLLVILRVLVQQWPQVCLSCKIF